MRFALASVCARIPLAFTISYPSINTRGTLSNKFPPSLVSFPKPPHVRLPAAERKLTNSPTTNTKTIQVDQWLETCWHELEVPTQALEEASGNQAVIAEAKRHLLSFLTTANEKLATR